MKIGIQTKTWPEMFIAVLIRIFEICKQPKCLQTDEWINEKWYIHSMEYYLAMKRNEKWMYATTCINIKNSMLINRIQS